MTGIKKRTLALMLSLAPEALAATATATTARRCGEIHALQ